MSTRRLVLLIEDCAATRLLYKYVLVAAGYHVIEADDGDTGIDMALALRPDVVITDVDLPTVDGLEAARRLRRDERTRATPIIVVTASPSRHCLARAHAVGCTAYLTKPCLPPTLLAAVAAALRARIERDALVEQA